METLKKVIEWIRSLPKALKYVVSIIMGFLLAVYILCACGTVAYVSNATQATTTLTITNEPNTEVSPNVNPNE